MADSPQNENLAAQLDDYVNGLLPAAEVQQLEQLCKTDQVYQAALEAARSRQAVLKSIPIHEASESLIQRTLQRITMNATKPVSRGKRFLQASGVLVAVVGLALGVLHWYWAELTPTAIDLRLVAQRTWLAGSDATLLVQLVGADTSGKVAAEDQKQVKVELLDTHTNTQVQLASFQTNSSGIGMPKFQIPDWQAGRYELKVSAQSSQGLEELYWPIELKRPWKIMLSSDKPVYQPGQTIQLRSLALRQPHLLPLADQRVEFLVSDPKGNVIFKHQSKTSRFGISAANCLLADEILHGPYSIDCRIGDTQSSLTVDVRPYVLPKFKVDVQLDRPYYQPGDKITGTVDANYFFGQPVAEGNVLLELRTIDVGPRLLEELSLKTDAQGKCPFSFTLPNKLFGNETASGDAVVQVAVQVTDAAGQQQSRIVPRNVTELPLRVTLIPENGHLVSSVENVVYLFVTYADGRPAPQVNLTVSNLEKPLTTDDWGLATMKLKPESKSVTLSIEATTPDGFGFAKSHTLKVGDGNEFLLRTDQGVYQGGGSVTVTVLGGGNEPVFVDVVKDGQMMLTEMVMVKEGHGIQHIDLPPDLFGTLELCAYRFGKHGLAERKKRVIYVQPAKQLNLQAEFAQPQYLPGGTALLKMALTNTEGQPVPGAISLAVVDEAVFSVLQQRPGLEQTFFTLEQELLAPVYAIYQWSPWDQEGQERPRTLEQSLFASTSTAISGSIPLGNTFGYLGEEMASRVEQPEDEYDVSEESFYVDTDQWHQDLVAATFPTKLRETLRLRELKLYQMIFLWSGWAFSIFVLIMATLWMWSPKIFAVVSVGMVASCCLLMCAGVGLLGVGMSAKFEGIASMLDPPTSAAPFPPGDEPMAGALSGPRIRQQFPETLLWKPQIITDDQGKAQVEFPVADSITTWRVSASAVSAEGRLAGVQSSLKVFQPFFVDLYLPVSLTRGDEVEIPAVVYNYLDSEQTVALSLQAEDWFEVQGDTEAQVKLPAGKVKNAAFRIKVLKVGRHTLQVTAKTAEAADAIKRSMEVRPNGRRVEETFAGNLSQGAQFQFDIPDTAIEGSIKAVVKIHPSVFSQLVEGLDQVFQRPFGCFEQTSSVTYPNILALDYLRHTKQSQPEVEAKARQYIHLGYQRLLNFEVAGGGFDWFGNPPANRTLTAYGLQEFEDMAEVFSVDPRLIDRTRRWLLDQRKGNGSWEPENHQFAGDPARGARSDSDARLAATAYIAWAVFRNGEARWSAPETRDYLLSFPPHLIEDPYLLALVAHALYGINPQQEELPKYWKLLDGMKQTSPDGRQCWWSQKAETRTEFFGTGVSGNIETTALVLLALMQAKADPTTIQRGLTWLVAQKDPQGTWHSTQATVLALKALLAGQTSPPSNAAHSITLTLNGQPLPPIQIPADQGEVMRQVEINTMEVGQNELKLGPEVDYAPGYQVTLSYYVPEPVTNEMRENVKDPLLVELVYDRSKLQVDDQVTATASITNNLPETAPMVLLDLPVPAGFKLDIADLEQLVKDQKIAKYQVTARAVVVYLRNLPSNDPLVFKYRFKATMPVKLTLPPAEAYQYYNPALRGRSQGSLLQVNARAEEA